jgi:hypothetical protein
MCYRFIKCSLALSGKRDESLNLSSNNTTIRDRDGDDQQKIDRHGQGSQDRIGWLFRIEN